MAEILHFEILRKHGQTHKHTNRHGHYNTSPSPYGGRGKHGHYNTSPSPYGGRGHYTLNTYNYSYERYNKKKYFSHHTLEEQKMPALYGAEKKNSVSENIKIFQPDQKTHPPPPPLEVKWSLPYVHENMHRL